MITIRLLAGIGATAAVAGFIAGVFSPRLPAAAPPAAAPVPAAAFDAGEPLPPLALPERARPQVPAGILARAADARALDRGPSCAAPDVGRLELARCASEQRESIEIEWHVAPER